MTSRGGGRGRGGFQQQSFPNRGRGDGGRGNFEGGRGGPGGGRVRGPPAVFRQNGRVHAPSQAIHELEDQSLSGSIETSLQRMSVTDLNAAPPRPAYGTKGKSIVLWANYFELVPSKDQPFNRYAVKIMPDGKGEEPKGKKLKRLVQLLLMQLPKNVPLASDYRSTILCTTTLGFTEHVYSIQYYSESEHSPRPEAPKFKAKVQFTGSLTFETLLDYLSSTDMMMDKPAVKDEIVQATNIVLGHAMKSNTDVMTKKNKYFPYASNPLVETWMLTSGLEAFRGFFMSVRAATGRILLNVQVQHIAMWEAIPLPQLIGKLQKENISPDEASRKISGLWVHVSHLNNRLKRITGFATVTDGQGTQRPPKVPKFAANASQVTFYRDNPAPAKYITVADYFKETYRKALAQPSLPLINVGTRRDPVYIPAEFCVVKSHQDYDKKLSPDATAKMIKFAVRAAPDNARTIDRNGINLLKANGEKNLNAFGVKLDSSMVTVHGRVLQGVSLSYGQRRTQTPRDASWNMSNLKFSSGAQIGKWAYIWVRTNQQSGRFESLGQVGRCVDQFHAILGKCGVNAPKATAGRELQLKNAADPSADIENFFSSIPKDIRLLLVILPNTSSAIYNAIKRAGDIKFGIHTVDVVADSKKFAKALDQDNTQYFANVALKFNLKFGGQNQLLQNTDLGFVGEGKTMLVGLDVTHPAPGSAKSAPSVSSITASIDSRLAQWPADVAIQTGREEMVEGLKDMFKSRLRLWQKSNKQQLPEEVIVYRDGVGDSMFDLVRTIELPQIKEACAEVYPATATKASKPYITIIICGKRHHTRFYPTNETDADTRTGGPKPGTIVDRGITETRVWDFYLQAHAALQGTPKSAHYVVVHDEIFRRRASAAKPSMNDKRTAGQRAQDDLEGLTHAMCYMFGRATKAVSLCPPAYYADLVCDRARRWLSGVFDERTVSSQGEAVAKAEDVRVHQNLKDTMFYI